MGSREKSQKILVGLSGGVDSAVAALLLQQEGYDVTAGFMINYMAPEGEHCPTKEDMAVAKEVAEYLEIPFFTFDYRDEYEKKVLEYMYEGYKKGITPNPDIMCNSEIKFRVFLDEAIEMGFDMVATGHYARISPPTSVNLSFPINNGENVKHKRDYFHLLKGIDSQKDQSYFLAGLTQDQLSKAVFPIGHLEKSKVREIAKKAGLPNANRKDSQGICFVGKIDIKEFLQKKIPNSIGDIVDTSGKVLGQHKGVFYYTIGQRKGLNIGGMPEPIFIVDKDIKNNLLIVGYGADDELYSDTLFIDELHILAQSREFPHECSAKIRYRQIDQACQVIDLTQSSPQGEVKHGYKIKFASPQRAIAKGQIIALYDGEELWGSGVIR